MSPGDLGPELERLPGVLAATVFETPRGPVVYLAVEPGVESDTVRARTLRLLRQHGMDASPHSIHIGTAPAQLNPRGIRDVSLDDVDVRRSDNRVHCLVRLRTRLGPLNGTDIDTDSPTGRARATARATLAAAETLEPDLRLGLHGARPIDLFGVDAVAVLVEAVLGRSHAHLPAATLVVRSLEEAAALATLQALRSWSP